MGWVWDCTRCDGTLSSLVYASHWPDVYQPFTASFPRANIHELLSPDLLHQIIKGTFKDHLVEWVGNYLENVHGEKGAKKILADIDRRCVMSVIFDVNILTLE